MSWGEVLNASAPPVCKKQYRVYCFFTVFAQVFKFLLPSGIMERSSRSASKAADQKKQLKVLLNKMRKPELLALLQAIENEHPSCLGKPRQEHVSEMRKVLLSDKSIRFCLEVKEGAIVLRNGKHGKQQSARAKTGKTSMRAAKAAEKKRLLSQQKALEADVKSKRNAVDGLMMAKFEALEKEVKELRAAQRVSGGATQAPEKEVEDVESETLEGGDSSTPDEIQKYTDEDDTDSDIAFAALQKRLFAESRRRKRRKKEKMAAKQKEEKKRLGRKEKKKRKLEAQLETEREAKLRKKAKRVERRASILRETLKARGRTYDDTEDVDILQRRVNNLPPAGNSSESSLSGDSGDGSRMSDIDGKAPAPQAAAEIRLRELEASVQELTWQKETAEQLKRLKQPGSKKQFEFLNQQSRCLAQVERLLQKEPGAEDVKKALVLVDQVVEACTQRKEDLLIAELGGWELVREYREGGGPFVGDKEEVKRESALLKAAQARLQAQGKLRHLPRVKEEGVNDLDPFSNSTSPCGLCSKTTHKTASCPQGRWKKKTTPKKGVLVGGGKRGRARGGKGRRSY